MGEPANVEGWTKKELRAAIGRRAKVSKKATKDELLVIYRSLEAAGGSGPIGLAVFSASTRDGMVAELDRLGIAHPPRATKRELTALYEAHAAPSSAVASSLEPSSASNVEPSIAAPSSVEPSIAAPSSAEPSIAATASMEQSSELASSTVASSAVASSAVASSAVASSAEVSSAVSPREPAPPRAVLPRVPPPWEPLPAPTDAVGVAHDDDEPAVSFETLPPDAHAEIDAAAADPDPDFRTHRPPAEASTTDPRSPPSLSPELRVESLPPEEGAALERLAAELPSLPPLAPVAPTHVHEPTADERRTSERVRLEVDIGFLSETNFYVGFSSDLSDGGIFIATVDLLPIGRRVLVSFMLPGGYDISTEGVVAWVREGRTFDSSVEPGMGVAFLDLDAGDRDEIREYTRLREPLFYLP